MGKLLRGDLKMDKLELVVFNVGHGLSVALIERPENYVTLVDLGAGSISVKMYYGNDGRPKWDFQTL